MNRARKVLIVSHGVVSGSRPHRVGPSSKKVRQAVCGTDCAPCANAAERRMAKLAGAAQVKLNLTEDLIERAGR